MRESMPTPLAASFEKPCRERAVEEPSVSRFSQQWKYIQKSKGQIFFYLNIDQKIPI